MNKAITGIDHHDHRCSEGPCYEGFAIAVSHKGVEYIQIAGSPEALQRLQPGILLDGTKIERVRVYKAP